MKDWSFNLPTWTYNIGYRLEGGSGTFDELYLYKNHKLVRMWGWTDRTPNIFELEEFIREIERNRFDHIAACL